MPFSRCFHIGGKDKGGRQFDREKNIGFNTYLE